MQNAKSDTKVWIAQCLCPQRHAILASAGEAENRRDAEENLARPLEAHIQYLFSIKFMDRWCGLCRAPADSWRYEVNRTRFRSMEEAAPALKQSEREQAVVRAIAAGRDR